MIKFIIYLVATTALSVVAYNSPLNYQYGDLKEYLNVLLNISSMVFTLMGIWIAFLYPNALQRILDPITVKNADFSEALTNTKRLEGLVGSVLKSAFIVIMIVVMMMLKLIFGGFDVVSMYMSFIKSIVISLVFMLTILQLEAIYYVIYSNIMFINDLHSKRENREADSDV